MARAKTLLNTAISEPFSPYRGEKALTTAAGWAPWWVASAEDGPDWKNRRPVYGRFTLDDRHVQQLSTPFGTHDGGLWQQVPTAEGNRYELTVEGQAWSSEDASPASQLEPSDVNMQIGVDPAGGLDAESPLVQWSDRVQPLSRWESLSLTFSAEAPIITIFLRSAPATPKRQQSVFWRNARLRPIGRYKRSINIVGAGDTHVTLHPERPLPGQPTQVTISSNRRHKFTDLLVQRPDDQSSAVILRGMGDDEERFTWQYEFVPDMDGLYELRFVGDGGARLLAVRLLRVARDVQLVPSDSARNEYERVYVLLPPTADAKWYVAAAKGSFEGRYTIGFSADDAGMGSLDSRQVLAVNPHHWPEVLTAAWFQQHYPGATFTAVVANSPEDLEAWLQNWTGGG